MRGGCCLCRWRSSKRGERERIVFRAHLLKRRNKCRIRRAADGDGGEHKKALREGCKLAALYGEVKELEAITRPRRHTRSPRPPPRSPSPPGGLSSEWELRTTFGDLE